MFLKIYFAGNSISSTYLAELMEIVEGNMLRYRASGWNAVGFTNDDSKDQITYINGSKVTRTEKPVLYIYDNNNNHYAFGFCQLYHSNCLLIQSFLETRSVHIYLYL